MGCWQLLQRKQCSCQVCPLYSNFREPVDRGRVGEHLKAQGLLGLGLGASSPHLA